LIKRRVFIDITDSVSNPVACLRSNCVPYQGTNVSKV